MEHDHRSATAAQDDTWLRVPRADGITGEPRIDLITAALNSVAPLTPRRKFRGDAWALLDQLDSADRSVGVHRVDLGSTAVVARIAETISDHTPVQREDRAGRTGPWECEQTLHGCSDALGANPTYEDVVSHQLEMVLAVLAHSPVNPLTISSEPSTPPTETE